MKSKTVTCTEMKRTVITSNKSCLVKIIDIVSNYYFILIDSFLTVNSKYIKYLESLNDLKTIII